MNGALSVQEPIIFRDLRLRAFYTPVSTRLRYSARHIAFAGLEQIYAIVNTLISSNLDLHL